MTSLDDSIRSRRCSSHSKIDPRTRSPWRMLLAALTCGTINNAAFCVLLGASAQIANDFNSSDNQPILVNLSTFGSVVGIIVNARFFVGRWSDTARLAILLTGFLAAYGAIIAAYGMLAGEPAGFWLCTAGAMTLGFCGSSGECLNLGVYRKHPPDVLSTWGAGTGIAGIAGPFCYIFLVNAFGFTPGNVATTMTFTLPIYGLIFHTMPKSSDVAHAGNPGAAIASSTGVGGGASEALMVNRDTASEAMTLDNFRLVSTCCSGILANMVSVYALEYMVTSGFMERALFCPNSSSWVADPRNSVPLFWALYNVGVTLSRASVALFRVRRVWILSLLQLVNMLIWGVEAKKQLHMETSGSLPYALLGLHMIFVGFMGGACYANCMYLFNTSGRIPDRLRELGINVGFFMSNCGILFATGIAAVLDHTLLDTRALFPPDGRCPHAAAAGHRTQSGGGHGLQAGISTVGYDEVAGSFVPYVGWLFL